jgi:hypothetical protein
MKSQKTGEALCQLRGAQATWRGAQVRGGQGLALQILWKNMF